MKIETTEDLQGFVREFVELQRQGRVYYGKGGLALPAMGFTDVDLDMIGPDRYKLVTIRKPKYRAWTAEDMLMGKAIRFKGWGHGSFATVLSASADGVLVAYAADKDDGGPKLHTRTYSRLLSQWECMNGSPCGVLEDD